MLSMMRTQSRFPANSFLEHDDVDEYSNVIWRDNSHSSETRREPTDKEIEKSLSRPRQDLRLENAYHASAPAASDERFYV